MKKLLFILSFMVAGAVVSAQDTESSNVQQPETFQMEWADSTVTMQKYFVVFLKRGPHRDQTEAEEAEIQERHLAYLSHLYQTGQTSITGPFEDDSDILGIVVFNTTTADEARQLAEQDPAVKAGRLVVEVHPWWAAKGSTLR